MLIYKKKGRNIKCQNQHFFPDNQQIPANKHIKDMS